MEHDTPNIPGGFKDNWEYKNTMGTHAQLFYQARISSTLQYQISGRYVLAKHAFNKSNNSIPLVNELINPNGNGIHFLFHIYKVF